MTPTEKLAEIREKCKGCTEGPWCVQQLNHCTGSLWLQIGYEKPDGTKWGPVCRVNSTGEQMPDGVVAQINHMATSEHRQWADAHLIAASKDLLAIATDLHAENERLREALEDIVQRNEIQHWFNLDKAKAALTGRAKG